jgi:hypothetical protein
VTLAVDNPKAFTAAPGTGAFLNSPAAKTSDLFTEVEHGDCELHIEFCVPQGSNSGVYLQGQYEIQILDSWGQPDDQVTFSSNGGIYARWIEETKTNYDGGAPRVNASRAPGEWQSFDITFRAPRFDSNGRKTENARFVKVVHNGQTIHENVEVDGPTRAAAFKDEKPLGPIKLQGDHGPVAFRNLRLKVP